jgi:hypothetical protein
LVSGALLSDRWLWLAAALSAARAPPPLAMAVATMIAIPRMPPDRCRASVVIYVSWS